MLAIKYLSSETTRNILDKLYRKHYLCMLRRVLTIVRDSHTAQDIVTDAILSLFDKAFVLEAMSDSECAAYMVRTAERHAYKYNKGAWRKKVTELFGTKQGLTLTPAASIEPEDLVLLRERRREIGAALRQLSERDQLLLDYRYYQGLSNREIAKLLHIPEDNVKKYMHLARRRALPLLKEALRDDR